jgi:hypothetical protein
MISYALSCKEEGNSSFIHKYWGEACCAYTEGLNKLSEAKGPPQGLTMGEIVEGKFDKAESRRTAADTEEGRDVKVLLLQNRAACYLKMGLWDKCIQVRRGPNPEVSYSIGYNFS